MSKQPSVSSKEIEIIKSLLLELDITKRYKYETLSKWLKREDLNKLIKLDIISTSLEIPKICPQCKTESINYKKENKKILLFCTYCKYMKRKNEEEFTYYSINMKGVLTLFLSVMFDKKYKIRQIACDDKLFCILEMKMGCIHIVFLPYKESPKMMNSLITDAIKYEANGRIFVVHDNIISEVIKNLKILVTNSVTRIIPISEINKKSTKKLIREAIEEIETNINFDKVLYENISDAKTITIVKEMRKNLQFFFNIVNSMKFLKKGAEKGQIRDKLGLFLDGITGSEDLAFWELLEKTVSAIFASLYVSRADIGGSSDKLKSIPDNIFIVHDESGIKIVGIVDAKSANIVKLDKEKSEKYKKYFEIIWGYDFFRHAEIPLIFIVIDFKLSDVIKFYKRIEETFKTHKKFRGANWYVVIIEINALFLLVKRFNDILYRIRLNLSDYFSSLDHLIKSVFGLEKLREIKTKYDGINTRIRNRKEKEEYTKYLQSERLFILDTKTLNNLFSKLLSKESGYDMVFNHIRRRADEE